jgi:hypothetical protein
MNSSYSGSEFVKALACGDLKPPIVLRGIAKLAHGDPHAFLFSAGKYHTPWVRIPVDMIDAVELVATVPFQGENYPYVHVRLKPVTNNPAATLFADLFLSELNPQPLPPRRQIELNPQPLPPRGDDELNPQPLPPRR